MFWNGGNFEKTSKYRGIAYYIYKLRVNAL
jgi:hypothetical protein